ncbi:uncharacterized protein LOC112885183 [Panicum hallii]|uniref:uncharacterized protein LOC112885183 n=1 Tax=Panicum hallii TaxID=206008 RepID=UPI000DF4EED3|nr:uncharacterized protein LOC112885183 [Panicum hallii]
MKEQLEQERRERAELEGQMRRERAELEGQMRAFVSYMQTYSREQGGPAPPPELMMPPRPPPGDVFSTPNVSVASNASPVELSSCRKSVPKCRKSVPKSGESICMGKLGTYTLRMH